MLNTEITFFSYGLGRAHPHGIGHCLVDPEQPVVFIYQKDGLRDGVNGLLPLSLGQSYLLFQFAPFLHFLL